MFKKLESLNYSHFSLYVDRFFYIIFPVLRSISEKLIAHMPKYCYSIELQFWQPSFVSLWTKILTDPKQPGPTNVSKKLQNTPAGL